MPVRKPRNLLNLVCSHAMMGAKKQANEKHTFIGSFVLQFDNYVILFFEGQGFKKTFYP